MAGKSSCQAIKTLSSPKALDYAKKNGIADAAKDPKCLKCHSTYDRIDAKLRGGILAEEGVSCETCHGPGSSYKSPSVMKNLAQAKSMALLSLTNNCAFNAIIKTIHSLKNSILKLMLQRSLILIQQRKINLFWTNILI